MSQPPTFQAIIESVEYDFRIIFYFQKLEDEEEEAIVLVDVGNDEVD